MRYRNSWGRRSILWSDIKNADISPVSCSTHWQHLPSQVYISGLTTHEVGFDAAVFTDEVNEYTCVWVRDKPYYLDKDSSKVKKVLVSLQNSLIKTLYECNK